MRAAYLPASSSQAAAAARTFSSRWMSFMKLARPTTSDQSVVTCSMASGVLAKVRSESFTETIFARFASQVFCASSHAALSCSGVQSVRSGAASTMPPSPPPEPFLPGSWEQAARIRAAARAARFMSGSLRLTVRNISPGIADPCPAQQDCCRMRVFHCDRYLVPLPAGHRFPIGKYRMLREILERDGLVRAAELRESDPIEIESLLLVHTPAYVDSLVHGTLSDPDQRRLGFPWSAELVLRSRCSAGGTPAAASAALEDGAAGKPARGTPPPFAAHHRGPLALHPPPSAP